MEVEFPEVDFRMTSIPGTTASGMQQSCISTDIAGRPLKANELN